METIEAIKDLTTDQLVKACICLDQKQKKNRTLQNQYKAELQARGSQIMEDRNIRYVKYRTEEGAVIIADGLSLDILNPDKLRELIGEGVYKTKIKEQVKTDYKCDPKLERALKAIFTGDYTFEATLEEFMGLMSVTPTQEQKKLLLKKLKGDYEKDRQTLQSCFGIGAYEEELDYIYRIKNAELIQAFLPEEGIDWTIQAIRKCILVESRTSITLDYEEETA